jgi:hypothetical protein
MLVCLCLLGLVVLLAVVMALLVTGGAFAPLRLLARWLPDVAADVCWPLVVISCAGTVVFVVAVAAADFVGASVAAGSTVAWLCWGAPAVVISCSVAQRVLQTV